MSGVSFVIGNDLQLKKVTFYTNTLDPSQNGFTVTLKDTFGAEKESGKFALTQSNINDLKAVLTELAKPVTDADVAQALSLIKVDLGSEESESEKKLTKNKKYLKNSFDNVLVLKSDDDLRKVIREDLELKVETKISLRNSTGGVLLVDAEGNDQGRNHKAIATRIDLEVKDHIIQSQAVIDNIQSQGGIVNGFSFVAARRSILERESSPIDPVIILTPGPPAPGKGGEPSHEYHLMPMYWQQRHQEGVPLATTAQIPTAEEGVANPEPDAVANKPIIPIIPTATVSDTTHRRR